MTEQAFLTDEELTKLMQEWGFAKDSKRLQILQQIFNPSIQERLTVIPNMEGIVHLNCMRGIAEILGDELGEFIMDLYKTELDLRMSTKGVSLDRFTTILEQQNAGDITIKNETIPQQVTEKRGILARVFGGGNSE